MSKPTYTNLDTTLDLTPMPDELSSPETKLVYLSLQTMDGYTVEELHRFLDVPKLSLFPILDTLRQRGLIDREDVADWGST